ncbi:NUDIX hydrolase [Pyrobaculum calidifontis]|uniref:NUDIX hydrolase n=1 Tax=Pyrobaculum calidifontis TaxID=181486 RepID=UPI0003227601|nr:NUDIX domain-containing protein [Pyrobaculum calidifontis]
MKKCIVASGVLIRDGKVLLVKHPKLGVYIYPGGHVEEGETPIEAVEREFREETGLAVEVMGARRGIRDENVIERPLPIVILEETVKYPNEVHIHFDLVYLVREVGGSLVNGVWVDLAEVERISTYPNVRQVIKLAASVISLYRSGNV